MLIHCAKKNICFELEYIQAVCHSLNLRASGSLQDEPLQVDSMENLINKSDQASGRSSLQEMVQ